MNLEVIEIEIYFLTNYSPLGNKVLWLRVFFINNTPLKINFNKNV